MTNAILSGDIKDGTVESVDISDGTIENADISASAAITYSKLNLTGSIQSSDLANGVLDISVTSDNLANGSVTYTKLTGNIPYGKLNIADYEIPFIKLEMTNTIETGNISDGTIENADISASAAITYTKLEMTNAILSGDIKDGTVESIDISDGTIENADISASAAITYTKLQMTNAILSGDIKDGTVASVDILDGTIENADISASAAITYTKLEMTNAILSGDIKDGTVASVDILDGTILTGDISDGTIENADISASAAITYTKLEMTNAILSGDIKDGTVASVDILDGTILTGDISDGTIENADISASAAITYTKLNLTGSIQVSDLANGVLYSSGSNTYTSITANKADFTNLTITNALVLVNPANSSFSISMTTTASSPRHITIPDISGTMVVAQGEGTSGQAVVSDGIGGYTWQTLSTGLTREVTVGEGGDYTSINAAIDSITDYGVSSRYVIKIGPGTYNERIALPGYVDIEGSGKNSTIITAPGSNDDPASMNSSSATILSSSDTSIRNLTIKCEGSFNYAIGIYNLATAPNIDDVIIDVSDGANETYGIYNYSNSSPIISNTKIVATDSGSGSVYGIFSKNHTSAYPLIKNSWIEVSGGNYSTGIHNNNSSPMIQHTNISVHSAANNNTGVKNESSSKPRMNHVDIEISGTSGSTNAAIDNSSSNSILNYVIGRTIVTTSGNNVGLLNNNSSPILNNSHFEAINGSANTRITNIGSGSTVLEGTTFTGKLVSESSVLTQLTVNGGVSLLTGIAFDGTTQNDSYKTEIRVDDPTQNNIITFPNESGTVMLSGAGGDMIYTSVTANKADFTNLTIANALVLLNQSNPTYSISMTTTASSPQQITIPDISGTMVVAQGVGTSGQAIVSDGIGGYTWQTLGTGLTKEIKVGDGGDFSTITEALDSITGSISNRYIIKVGPGTFNEQVTMEAYVDIEGSGINNTIIKYTGGSTSPDTDGSSATIIGADNAELRNLTVESDTASGYAVGIYNISVAPRLNNLYIDVKNSSTRSYGIYNKTDASPVIDNVEIMASSTGSYCFGIFNNNNSSAFPQILNSKIKVMDSSYIIAIHNDTSDCYINNVRLQLENGQGTSYGIYDYYITNSEIHNVIIDISGSGCSEYLGFKLDNSDTIIHNALVKSYVTGGDNHGIQLINSSPELSEIKLDLAGGATNIDIAKNSSSNYTLKNSKYVGTITADAISLTQLTVINAITFQGYSSTDAYETTFTVEEPTNANTITFPNESGTVILSGGSGGSLNLSSVTANSGTYTALEVSNQVTLSATTVSGDMMLADEYSAITTNSTPADTAFYFGDKTTEGAWRMVRVGTSLVFQRRETGTWVSKMSVNP
ncbi:Pectinesterase, catalytic domain protein, partial [Candidatus Magnetomorum sp. HK-1]